MRIAYLDGSSGVSGDMLLAALVSAGGSVDAVNTAIQRIGMNFSLRAEPLAGSAVGALRILFHGPGGRERVLGTGDHEDTDTEIPHPHIPEHQHGPRRKKSAAAHSSKTVAHRHAPQKTKGHVHGAHTHIYTRTVSEVLALVERAQLSPRAQKLARAAFEHLAEAEARVHKTDASRVHFHEVGQDDAIVDVVGCALLFDALGIERMVCSALNVGSGAVECAHGRFPVPAPATLELLKGVPVYSTGIEAELVTPTGAALVRALADEFGPMPPMIPSQSGFGAGSYHLDGHADVLRIIVGESVGAGESLGSMPNMAGFASGSAHQVTVIEANLDDMNPQFYGYISDKAFEAGALDVYTVPVQMKKGRPGTLITVLAHVEDTDRLVRLLLDETTTIGVRTYTAQRTTLMRKTISVSTRFGAVRIKVASDGERTLNASPEYEDCRHAAAKSGAPLKLVYQEALRAYWDTVAQPKPE